jgi:hypothetical protein
MTMRTRAIAFVITFPSRARALPTGVEFFTKRPMPATHANATRRTNSKWTHVLPVQSGQTGTGLLPAQWKLSTNQLLA